MDDGFQRKSIENQERLDQLQRHIRQRSDRQLKDAKKACQQELSEKSRLLSLKSDDLNEKTNDLQLRETELAANISSFNSEKEADDQVRLSIVIKCIRG